MRTAWLIPYRFTVLCFLIMTALWALIALEFFENLSEPWETIGTIAALLSILTLSGVYSARTALRQPAKAGNWPFLVSIGLRAATLLGLSAAVMSVFGD
jgi:hypothetical protein